MSIINQNNILLIKYMWLILKNENEIELIIEKNKYKKERLIKVSQTKSKPLWYANKPLKKDYKDYINYVKAIISFIRTHNSWTWNYFWKIAFKKEIINNYWQYTFMRKWHCWYIVEGEVILNRHLILSTIFKHKCLGNLVHNFPPSIFKYIFLMYIVDKYNLDSYEIWWMRKSEIKVWKYIFNINAFEDWDYVILKNTNNLKISTIKANQK